MGYWDDDEQEFRDDISQQDQLLAEQDFIQHAPAPKMNAPAAHMADAAPDQDTEEEDYTDVLTDARLRLEQGRLYELLMNHNMFEGVQADGRAIKNVQREIRRYAKERMEIMLGMRQLQGSPETRGAFNETEIQVLKMLARAASNGKTASSLPALAPISSPKPPQMPPRPAAKIVAKPIIKPEVKKPAEIKPPSPPSPKRPPVQSRKKSDVVVEKIAREVGVRREDLEEDYKPLEKDPSLMTEKEKISRNKEIRKRLRNQVKSPHALPMPSFEQQAAHYTQLADHNAQNAMDLLLAAKRRK